MFKRITDVKPELKSYLKKMPSYFPIRNPLTLLEYRNIAPFVAQLPKIVNAPKEYYDALYKEPIVRLADFVQGLPTSKITQFNHYGGLLELGCRRALKTLQHYRQEYPITNIKPENMPPRLALWTYALFTGGLFYGIGEVVATYSVGVCDEKGQHNVNWEPFAGPMSKLGTHYRYCFESINRDDLAARATPLIAKHLLPAEGYNWIASDKEVFNYWLALLQNDERGAGVLAKMVMFVNDQLLQEMLLQQQAAQQSTPFLDETIPKGSESLISLANPEKAPAMEATPAASLDVNNPQGTNSGDAFVNWLRNNLRNGAITTNLPDSLVHLGRDGIVVLHPDIYQSFLKSNPQYKTTAQEIRRSLEVAGLAITNPRKAQQYKSDTQTISSQIKIPTANGNPAATNAAALAKVTLLLPSLVFHASNIPGVTYDMKAAPPLATRAYPSLDVSTNLTATVGPSKGG